MKLRDYDRAELLALPAGPELDALVKQSARLNYEWGKDSPSRDLNWVGVMLLELREYWPLSLIYWYLGETPCIASTREMPLPNDATMIMRDELPHVCALALVLAAWEKAQ